MYKNYTNKFGMSKRHINKIWLIMRLTTVILIATFLQVSATGFAQKITLSRLNAPLKTILKDIRNQSGYIFLYTENQLKAAKPVNIKVNGEDFQEVLEKIFENQPLTYVINEKTITIKDREKSLIDRVIDYFSNIDVTGKIVDENGEPLAGASVLIKGINRVTATNEKGEFSFSNVDEKAILLISYIGYQTKEIEVKKDLGTISLTIATAKLDEVAVVSTGYQEIKPNEVTGAVTLIDNATLNQQVGTNILRRLDGVTSGLSFFTNKSNRNPQSDLNMSIRGLSTINGPLNPLVVLDNFIYEGDINNINPNDIESVSILKDAGATSIYGARGGNGVIVLTTKKWKAGQPTTIEFNSNVIVSEKPDLFYVSQISSADYIEVEQFLYNRGFYNNIINSVATQRRPFSPALQVFLDRKSGLISREDSLSRINQLKVYDIRNDYEKYFYTKAITQQYAVNIRGGGNTNSYTFSGAIDRNKGTNYDLSNKINLSFQNVYQPIHNLRLNIGAYYTNRTATSGRNSTVLFDGKRIPYLRLADEEGNAIPIPTYNKLYTDTAGRGKLLNWNFYPLDNYKYETLKTNIEEIVANIGINYTLLPGFDIDLKYQYQRQMSNGERNSTVESFYARNLINQFSQINYATGDIKYIVPMGDIHSLSNGSTNSQNLRLQTNYQKQWQKHTIIGMVGAEIREIISKNNRSTLYGYSDDPLGIAVVDYLNQYKTLPTGSLQTIGGSPTATFRNNRFLSVYSNFSYLYNDRYSFSGSMRKDGANILGVATNEKWKPLWSAGLGWQLSKEGFYQLGFLPYLKMRASYGYSGNLDLSKTALPIAGYFINSLTNLSTTQIITLSNPSLQWEESQQLNLAVDFRSKNNTISGSIDFYTKKGKNLYGNANYDYTTWGPSVQITKNVADMSGRGMDIRLTSKNADKRFKWITELLFNYNESKVTAYYTRAAELGNTLVGGSGGSITPVIGKPLYSLAAYRWMGLNKQGDPQGILNGQITTDWRSISNSISQIGINNNESVKYIGSAVPTIFGSLMNTFTWKKASISINLNYKFGYFFKKQNLSYSSLFNQGIGTNDFSQRWQQPGDEVTTNVPAMVYTNYTQFNNRETFYNGAEIHYLKGDHIRLQYINIGYKVKDASQKSRTQARLYANVSNLGLLWTANKENLDPDYPTSFQPVRNFAMGIQITY